MAAQGEALAGQLESLNSTIATLVGGLSDSECSRICSSEGWSIGVTAHHLAGSYAPISGMVQAIATGGPIPPITPQLIDQLNAQHAQEFAEVTREQAVEALQQGSAQAAAVLRGLSDDQLQHKADLFGDTVSAEQVTQGILLAHAQEHLNSIQAALAAG